VVRMKDRGGSWQKESKEHSRRAHFGGGTRTRLWACGGALRLKDEY